MEIREGLTARLNYSVLRIHGLDDNNNPVMLSFPAKKIKELIDQDNEKWKQAVCTHERDDEWVCIKCGLDLGE